MKALRLGFCVTFAMSCALLLPTAASAQEVFGGLHAHAVGDAGLQRAQRAGDYAKASELQYGKVPPLEADIKKHEARLQELQKAKSMLKEEVDEEDIAEVVSRWTGVPVSTLFREAGAQCPCRGSRGRRP